MDNSHYSIALDAERLRAWSKEYADKLKETLRPGEIPVLCFRGLSGIASGTALALALHEAGVKHGMIYTRKPGESAHSSRDVERGLPSVGVDEYFTLVFVDDFMDSGDTREIVLGTAKAHVQACAEGIINAVSGANDRDTWVAGLWRSDWDAVQERNSLRPICA